MAATSVQWPDLDALVALRREVADSYGVEYTDVGLVTSPYRVCPLGAHIDHQGGPVSALTVNFGLTLAYAPSGNSRTQVSSSVFEGKVAFDLSDVPPKGSGEEESDWGNFPRGAVDALQRAGHALKTGIVGHVIAPKGLDSSGISSSAALGVAFLLAFEAANGMTLTAEQNIELDRMIENEYIGLKNGILDQSAILLSRKETLTVMDCLKREHRLCRAPWEEEDASRPFAILLTFSGIREALAAGSSFNSRVEECHTAGRELRELGGETVAGDGPTILGSVALQYEKFKARMSETSQRRAAHFFTESARVLAGAEAWSAGDIDRFGALMTESGRSSIENYEVGTPQLKLLQGLLQGHPHVYGARFSGAGTRGACVALVQRAHAQAIAEEVLQTYRKEYPHLHPMAVVTEPGEGARVLRHHTEKFFSV